MYGAENIKWVKNVKRDDGTAWAYFDAYMENEFPLNFSEAQKIGNNHLHPGEIILLFQRVDKIIGVKKKTYLTHLVTPLDNNVFYNPDNPDFPYERRVAVIARANPLDSIFTTPATLNFYKPQWGKLCGIEMLNDTQQNEEIQQTIWALFQRHFNPDYEVYIEQAETISKSISFEEISVIEGREIEIVKRHLVRERDSRIIAKAKAEALKNGNGTIKCDCCQFEFTDKYGEQGKGFIECHHKQPISEGGERVTTLDDLAMVCSNCHRMLHRKNKNGEYYSVEQLRNLISSLLAYKSK